MRTIEFVFFVHACRRCANIYIYRLAHAILLTKRFGAQTSGCKLKSQSGVADGSISIIDLIFVCVTNNKELFPLSKQKRSRHPVEYDSNMLFFLYQTLYCCAILAKFRMVSIDVFLPSC